MTSSVAPLDPMVRWDEVGSNRCNRRGSRRSFLFAARTHPRSADRRLCLRTPVRRARCAEGGSHGVWLSGGRTFRCAGKSVGRIGDDRLVFGGRVFHWHLKPPP